MNIKAIAKPTCRSVAPGMTRPQAIMAIPIPDRSTAVFLEKSPMNVYTPPPPASTNPTIVFGGVPLAIAQTADQADKAALRPG